MTALLKRGWTVSPVRLGTMSVETSQLVRGADPGVRIDIPCTAWILRGPDGVIVVDTGPADADWSRRHHNPMRRPAEEDVEEAFARAGVDVCEVDVVINSHLHWDHCYGNRAFPRARFLVQAAEVAYAAQPCPCDAPIYETQPPVYQAFQDQIEEVDGEKTLCGGITLLPTPGHTPGHQAVLVQGQERRIAVAGDAVGLYRNLDGAGTPGALFTDLPAWYESLALMRERADLILPGHDARVFAAETYT